ncbi:MAG: pantetheine-phosphate adenylyltransferase [Lachnospiraceae bacterium]|nr:pantetheine-phosphate adenylyltransferase [Lachnospiraceae bacterium]
MKTAIYPGSFDPVTFGHLDIIRRAARMFHRVTVVVMNNASKHTLFSVDERVKMLQNAVSEIKNVSVDAHDSLLIDYCKEKRVRIVIRGLRAVTDFEYELQIAQTNKALSQGKVDTVFLTTSLRYAYVSSSMVKEVAHFGGDVSKLVPEDIAHALYLKNNTR